MRLAGLPAVVAFVAIRGRHSRRICVELLRAGLPGAGRARILDGGA